MSKKKNNRQNAEKETQKGPVQNEYTVSATLIDCTYCEELQELVSKYKKECDKLKTLNNNLQRESSYWEQIAKNKNQDCIKYLDTISKQNTYANALREHIKWLKHNLPWYRKVKLFESQEQEAREHCLTEKLLAVNKSIKDW